MEIDALHPLRASKQLSLDVQPHRGGLCRELLQDGGRSNTRGSGISLGIDEARVGASTNPHISPKCERVDLHASGHVWHENYLHKVVVVNDRLAAFCPHFLKLHITRALASRRGWNGAS
jgi:hypothetical protein